MARTLRFPPPHSLDQHIRAAIAQRRLLQLTYGGRTRIVEPHDYGLINDETKLLVYQRREEGASRPPGWRLLAVGKITALDLLEDTFEGSREAGQDHRFNWAPLFARVR